MLSVHCPRHGANVLLGDRAIERIENHADGMTLRWRCTCGERGRLRIGRTRRQ